MNKFPLTAVLVSISLLGASCQGPQETTFTNTPDYYATDDTPMINHPQSDKVGQKIEITTPDNLPSQRIETGSDSKVGPAAILNTTMGDIKIRLFEEATPNTVRNFITLAEQDFYDGTVFHRVIPNFMIQGGDPLTREMRDMPQVHGTGGPGYKFADEISLHKNARGTISMANSGPNTNGSQFFINTVNNSHLDGRHAVFGEVIEGMDIVDQIQRVQTGSADHPMQDIEILDIVIER